MKNLTGKEGAAVAQQKRAISSKGMIEEVKVLTQKIDVTILFNAAIICGKIGHFCRNGKPSFVILNDKFCILN